MNSKRINVGLFVGNIMDTFSNLVCRGAINAAEEMDVNLIIFPGNYLNFNRTDDMGLAFEYQPNILFSYADKDGIDVLLACIGSIGSFTPHEKRREILDAVGVPVVTIASNEGYPYVSYDNYHGLRDAVEYVITEKHKRKIAMLSGPISNDDFEQRLDTFREVLNTHHIPITENMIAYGDASRYSTLQVEELLDNNPGLEAIVCGNDDMAFAVYQVCLRRDITIGKDLLVVGFDDVEAACKLSPPLASVRADASALGYQALIEALHLLQGEEDVTKIIPTRFIPRESVAYEGERIGRLLERMFVNPVSDEGHRHLAETILDYVFYADSQNSKANAYIDNIMKILDSLAQFADTDVCQSEVVEQVRNSFAKLIHKSFVEYADQHRIIRIYTLALRELERTNKGLTYKKIVSSILTEQLQFLMDSIIYRSNEDKKQLGALMHSTNMLSRDMLMSDNIGESPYYNIISKMQMLDIERSCLYVYEKPQKHVYGESWVRPKYILMKAYQVGDVTTPIPRTRQKILSNEVFSNAFFSTAERHTWVVHDLYSREWQYGLFVCDLRYQVFNLAELLTYQISTAVKMLNLFQREQATHKKLEETLEQLTLNNITLDRMSRFDELTGILNRRGFMEQSAELLEKATGKAVLVIYADLDSLKIINDLFGHDEGDYALRGATQILSLSFYEKGVIGRLGGDEFAALMIRENEDDRDQIYLTILRNIEEYNRGIDKPYRVQLSVGIDEITFQPGMLISDMLSQADELLYQAKKTKKDILRKGQKETISENEVEMMVKQLTEGE